MSTNTANIPNTPMFIVSKLNGRVIDVEKSSDSDGAKICVFHKKEDPGNKNQLWKYEDGCFVNVHSSKVLDVKGDKIQSDVSLVQNSKASTSGTGADMPCWEIDNEGYIYLKSHPDLVVDINKQEDKDGAELILYTKRAGTVAANQQWQLEAHGSA